MSPAEESEKTKRRLKFTDILIGIVILAVCVVLGKMLVDQLNIKHEAASATAVTDSIIHDIRAKDGYAVRKQGDDIFQTQNTAKNLTAQFTAASSLTKPSTVIDRKTITNTGKLQAVSNLYKFNGKSPFYVRVIVTRQAGTSRWQLANLKADTSEKSLLNNKY